MKFSSQRMLTAEREPTENMTISLTDPFPTGCGAFRRKEPPDKPGALTCCLTERNRDSA
jgi:hypothetical protein